MRRARRRAQYDHLRAPSIRWSACSPQLPGAGTWGETAPTCVAHRPRRSRART